MTLRQLGIMSALIGNFILTNSAMAQAPAASSMYSGSFGGGLAVTNGNTNTRSFNLSGAIVRDPKTKNVIKGAASYLRGSQSDILNLDRTAINARDEYTISTRTYTFGQIDYVRDQFKDMIFFWAPTAGLGYKLINTDRTQLTVDGGAGGVLEKNPGIDAKKSGSVTTGHHFQRKLSSTAAFTEGMSSIWKTQDFNDSLTNFSVGLTTAVSGKLQLKLEFVDSYKNRPPRVTIKKNDTAFVTTFAMKF